MLINFNISNIIFNILDPQIKYINLTSQHIERYYQGEKGSNVQWVVYIDGFPKPHLQW